ncbi:hypothetical protein PT974_12272 [Cladobotryum mycophilum]|uniref:Metallo-beta-lactamase domain-containing protein n=1 Tax=Cladobotryum mycophilum TaxID=491253 RepID=A0ABR0S7I4_9HYPO
MAERFYSVHTYQININVGDAAIHILASQTNANRLRPNGPIDRKVHRAVLIDGGTSVKPAGERPNAHPNIYSTILDIESKFECQGPNRGGRQGNRPLLQFDGFIVTHWDSDHCDGLMHFLLEDILTQLPEPNRGDMRLKRARYDENNNYEPLSWLYAPSWKRFDERNPSLYPTGSSEHFSNWFESSYDRNNQIGRRLPLDAVLYGLTPELVPRQGKIRTHKLLRMCIGKADLLGRNLFNPFQDQNQSLVIELPDMPNIPDLLKYNDPAQALIGTNTGAKGPIPGLYCLASNGYVIAAPNRVLITERNRSSISTAIIWSPDHNGPRVSHYMAGDAHIALEREICNWIGFTTDDYKRVTVVKLSHHGASSSSPEILFQKLKPETILISAGDHLGHGHPRWEIMMLLHRHFKYPKLGIMSPPCPLLFSRYPIYLASSPYQFRRTSNGAAITILTETLRRHIAHFRNARGFFFAERFLTETAKENKAAQLTAIYNEIRDVIFKQYAVNNLMLQTGVETQANHITVFGIPRDARSGCVETKLVGDLDEERWYELVYFGNPPPPGYSLPMLEDCGKHKRTLSIGSVDSWDMLSTDGSESSYGNQDLQSRRLVSATFTPLTSSSSPPSVWVENNEQHHIIPQGAPSPEDKITFDIISAKNPFHPFLDKLWMRRLCLKRHPLTTQKDTVPFINDDEWLRWLQTCLLSPGTQMSMFTTTWPIGEEELPNFECRADLCNGRMLILETVNIHEILGVEKTLIPSLYKEKGMVAFAARFELTPPTPPPVDPPTDSLRPAMILK